MKIYLNDESIPPVFAAEQSLRDAVQNLGGLGLAGHVGSVTAVATSPDGRWLVTGSYDKTARLWDLSAAEPERTARVLAGHVGPVSAVAISTDGNSAGDRELGQNRAAAGTSPPPSPGRSARVLAGHTGYVYAVAISPDGKVAGDRE